MIKANELRIGNYVTTIDDKITCTSVKVTKTDIDRISCLSIICAMIHH